MTSYLIRRILLIVPTVFFAISFLFLLFFTLPGDPANLIAGGGDRAPDPGVLERVEERYGFNDPLYAQFANYWQRTVHVGPRRVLPQRAQRQRAARRTGGQQPPAGRLGRHHRGDRRHQRGPALGGPAILGRRSSHDDPHRGRVRDPRLRARLRPPVPLRRPPEPERLARVGPPAHVRPRPRHLDALLHPHRRAVALPAAAGPRPRRGVHGPGGAHDPGLDARGHASRLHAHGAGQGACASATSSPATASAMQCSRS